MKLLLIPLVPAIAIGIGLVARELADETPTGTAITTTTGVTTTTTTITPNVTKAPPQPTPAPCGPNCGMDA